MKNANTKTQALLLDIASQQLLLLIPPAPRPAILCLSVQERRPMLLQPEGGHPQGMPVKERPWEMHRLAACVGLLWNGSFSLALVFALGHAKVVEACISWKKALLTEKEI